MQVSELITIRSSTGWQQLSQWAFRTNLRLCVYRSGERSAGPEVGGSRNPSQDDSGGCCCVCGGSGCFHTVHRLVHRLCARPRRRGPVPLHPRRGRGNARRHQGKQSGGASRLGQTPNNAKRTSRPGGCPPINVGLAGLLPLASQKGHPTPVPSPTGGTITSASTSVVNGRTNGAGWPLPPDRSVRTYLATT